MDTGYFQALVDVLAIHTVSRYNVSESFLYLTEHLQP